MENPVCELNRTEIWAMNLHRLRFEQTTPLSWRTDGALVIGFADQPASNSISVVEHGREVAVWLSLLDGSREIADLVSSAQAMGIDELAIRRLLADLLQAGHVYEVETTAETAGSETLLRDLRHNSRLYGGSLSTVLSKRQASAVLVLGAGNLAWTVVEALQASLVPVGWEPDSNLKIRSQDHLSGAFVFGRTWRSQRIELANPQLVIAIADVHDPELLEQRYPSTPILLVTAHLRRISIGPTLNLRNSPCHACLNATHHSLDTEWGFAITQLIHRHRPLQALGEPWLKMAAYQIAACVLEGIDGAGIGVVANHSLELAPPDVIWRKRAWHRRPDCSCSKSVQQVQQLISEEESALTSWAEGFG